MIDVTMDEANSMEVDGDFVCCRQPGPVGLSLQMDILMICVTDRDGRQIACFTVQMPSIRYVVLSMSLLVTGSFTGYELP